MSLEQSSLITVKRMPRKGRGVFAKEFIRAGTTIERVPVLVVPIADIAASRLADYAFTWSRRRVALALGYGSLYNHSYTPNARYLEAGRSAQEFVAIRDIVPGEEITVNYNGDPDDRSAMDFDVL